MASIKDKLNKVIKQGQADTAATVDPAIKRDESKALVEVEKLKDNLKLYSLKYDPKDIAGCSRVYQAISEIREQAKTKLKWWNALMEGPIAKIRSGLDDLYAVRREIATPLEALVDSTNKSMKQFKEDEAYYVRQAEIEKQQKADELRRKAEEQERKIQSAGTPQMRARLEQRRKELEQAAETVEDQETETVEATGTGSRAKPKWFATTDPRIILKGILDNKIPIEVFTLNEKWINGYFKIRPDEVMEWPGFEVRDDITITSR